MHTTYNPLLVTLSILIAMLASFAALDLASRVSVARGWTRLWWLAGGSLAMGIGIWSMHFVAMLALTLPVPIVYDTALVLLSVLVAIGASLLALLAAGQAKGLRSLAFAAPMLGTAIAGMHYIGMAAVHAPGQHRYNPLLVTLSVIIAITASFAALWLAFRLRDDASRYAWLRKAASAMVMGLAIAGMHYTAMAAVTFHPGQELAAIASGKFLATPGLATAVVLMSVIILAMALSSATVDQWVRMHAAVKESEERFRLLVENVQDHAIFGLDAQGNVVSWNHGAERLEGYSREEILGKQFSCFFPPEDTDKPHLALRTAASTGRWEMEGWRVKKGGSRYYASSVINALLDKEGHPAGFVQISRDITDRRRTEEALLHSEASLRSFVDHAPLGIYRSSADGHFLAVNAALVQMLGHDSEAQLRGVEMASGVYADPGERSRLVEQYASHDRIDVNALWKRRDGTPIRVRITGRPIREEDGKIKYWEAFVEDVTPLKAAERALRESEEQLRQSQKMEAIGTLAGGVAHDFNNVLTAIKTNLQLLLMDLPANSLMREDLEEVDRAADRAASLTRQLLAFSRKQVLQPKVLDLNGVVAEMEKMLGRLIGEDIGLVTIPGVALGQIRADPGQLEQVIMNLAINGRDAMPAGGVLTIETQNVEQNVVFLHRHGVIDTGAYIMLTVSDNGSGMDEKTQERIFDPFFTTKGPGKGTGLGLSTVYGIVRQSGGYIRMHSEIGEGTTFQIYLPRLAHSENLSTCTPRETQVLHGCETILLVEDEEGVRSSIRRILERNGYTVLEARHGSDALAISRTSEVPIHLILTDVVMPQMGGRELVEQLRTSCPEVRVIYMSGYTDDDIIRRGLIDRRTAFLQKPFSMDDLARRVRSVLDAPSLASVS